MSASTLTKRLVVAAWGIPLLLGLTWLGGWWTAALVAGLSTIAQIEYYRIQEVLNRKPLTEVGIIAGLAVVALWQIGGMEAIGWTLAVFFLTIALAVMLTNRSHTDLLATFGGIAYPPLLGGSFLIVRGFDPTSSSGLWLAFGLFGGIWICDTAAYFFGRLTGKHKLAPAISPGKTVEGFIWGAIASTIFALIWWWFGFIEFDIAIALAFVTGVIGQLGDLVESALKREAGVKDSGTFLPGHGGALDRFDSLFAAAPALAMYLTVRDQVLYLFM